MQSKRAIGLGLALATLAACGDAEPTNPAQVATSITFELDTLDYGTTITPDIVVLDQAGAPMTGSLAGHLAMGSSDTTVATTDDDAITITGTGIGEATITVHYDDLQSSAVLPVRLGPAPARRLSSGDRHSCYLDDNGAASCWGADSSGQLGDGDNESSASPVAVLGGHVFSHIEAGYRHSCALENGSAWCWGDGLEGALGNGSDTTAAAPVQVAGGLIFTQLSAGVVESCALTAQGAAYCWGTNGEGALGIGSTNPSDRSNVPVPVAGGVSFARILANGLRSVCALTRLGKLYCWGSGAEGVLGTGDQNDQPSPIAVADSLTFVALGGGSHYTCGMDREGRVFCWGRNNERQVGNSNVLDPAVLHPTQVETTARFTAIADGAFGHLCGIDGSGALLCWGSNGNGEIGDGTHVGASVPVQVPSFVAKEVATGGFHSCAIAMDDHVYCWGSNADGQVGNGSSDGADVLSPGSGLES